MSNPENLNLLRFHFNKAHARPPTCFCYSIRINKVILIWLNILRWVIQYHRIDLAWSENFGLVSEFEFNRKSVDMYISFPEVFECLIPASEANACVTSICKGNCSRICVTSSYHSRNKKMASSRSDNKWCVRWDFCPKTLWTRPWDGKSLTVSQGL